MTGEENWLPAGTVTFLFTDIERSTESAAALGDERYAEALQAHRALLRPAFTAHGGVEVGTEGDAFFVAFARAGDAVNAAIEGQRAMEAHAWSESRLRVRVGLHTGEALLIDNDYVGHDVHKAKRVCDAGHGGQVLLSQTTADLVRSSVTLKSLGLHRLKDLGEPQPLFQVTGDGLETEFPPLRTLDTATHNLPVQLTTFVGREKELAEVSELFATHRLVTLTGVGGCGKTRLAIHAAAAEIDSSPDGVYFVDLSRLSDEVGLVPAMAKALGLDLGVDQPAAAQEASDAVKTFLSRRNALLVLDNCEHLIVAAAELVEDILTLCPFVRVLATSREALDVPGEHTWPIPSLSATGEAARLFAERAASARGGFTLDESNRSDVDAICERLDGIPLAIELAAAQTGHLSPRQIAERLDQRFMILTGGRRRVQRQQTLQAAMDWSWDLLDERDQTLLRRLSVFQGGCTLEAAEAVCGEGLDVVAGLRSLVAKSLLNADQSGQQTRYRLLETVRLYAETKQAESGESEAIRTRHRDHVLSWLEAIPVVRTLWGPIFRSELLPEEDNIRAAVRWSEAAGDSEETARILCATDRLWVAHLSEAHPLYARALQAQLPGRLRGRLLLASASMSIENLTAILSLDDEAIALLGDVPDPWLVKAHGQYAVVAHLWAMLTKDHELAVRAEASAERAIELGRGLGPVFEAAGHTARANVLMMQLRNREAADAVIEAVRLSKGTLLPERHVHVQFLRSLHHVLGDDWPPEYDPELRDITADMSVSPFNTSAVLDLVAAGDLAQADRFVCEFVSLDRDRLFLWSIPFAFFGVALAMRARFEDAAIFLAAAMQEGFIANAGAYALYRHWLPKVREALGPERSRELRDQGRAMNREQLFERLLALHAPASTPGSHGSKAAAWP